LKVEATSKRDRVAGHPVHAVGNAEAVRLIIQRAMEGTPGAYVCLTNVNNVVQSQSMPKLREAAEGAFLSLPDGYPLAWILRRRGYGGAEKLGGPDLMPLLADRGREVGLRHFMYGWTTRLGAATGQGLRGLAPGALIVGSGSPPFARAQGFPDEAGVVPAAGTPLAPDWVDMGGAVQDVDWRLDDLQTALKEARPHILWVGLGSPVQEEWMAMVAGKLDVPVMIGVGRAFNYQAGLQRRCPPFMTRIGLEWLYTLLSEPRRLWRRYLLGNPRFVYLVARSAWNGEGPGRSRG
jgi:N-acetylglucosaminyldiphosphoundecaprenol N-acetyl-beta-D-mannosaminyltransferase